jgi:hypothetical protein
MNEKSMITIKAVSTDDGIALERQVQGEFSFLDMVNIGFNLIETSMHAMCANVPDEVDLDELKGAIYDDINMRCAALLDSFIPEEELPRDFTEEAQQALSDENTYTELKFKAEQYDKLYAAQGITRKVPKATFDKKGVINIA